MKNQFLNTIYCTIILFSITACDSKPKVIQSEPTTVSTSNDLYRVPEANKKLATNTSPSTTVHKVLVEEVLNTEKYNYLSVSEEGKKYWIAISKQDVKVGDTYYYKGGLLKKNFQSREFNRVFETVYLVSNIWKPSPGGHGGTALDEANAKIRGGEQLQDVEVGKIAPSQGAISLATLFSNKEKYRDQVIKITGKCVKVNPMIMNRNWIHIQDGSGQDLDLTITTTESIPLGAVVSLEGKITIDKDFGAGYRYDIIMEEAVLK